MGHSNGNPGNALLSTLKSILVGVLKIACLMLCFAMCLAGNILIKMSDAIKQIVEK